MSGFGWSYKVIIINTLAKLKTQIYKNKLIRSIKLQIKRQKVLKFFNSSFDIIKLKIKRENFYKCYFENWQEKKHFFPSKSF